MLEKHFNKRKYLVNINYLLVQLEEMMRWGDKDGDGRVGAQEFSSMMMETMREAFKIEKEKKCEIFHILAFVW